MSKDYPSNLTREQDELIYDLLPMAKPGGRPREVDLFEILNAIFYVLVEGIRWRALPGDFPPWQTVYTSFRNWRKDSTWVQIHDRLHAWTRLEQGRCVSPSEVIIDSQSVKSAAGIQETVGYDGGKQIKGRKRFIAVDTLSLWLRVRVLAANVGEQTGARGLLERVHQMGASGRPSAPYLGRWGLWGAAIEPVGHGYLSLGTAGRAAPPGNPRVQGGQAAVESGTHSGLADARMALT
jgi:transposase